MSSGDIKQVVLTGGAVLDYSGGQKRRTPRSKKKTQMGGVALPVPASSLSSPVSAPSALLPVPSASPASSASASPASPASASSASASPASPASAPMQRASPASPASHAVPDQTGGAVKSFKVELKRRATAKKVHLQPKKAEGQKPVGKKAGTKRARRVTLGLSSLHKRVNRAKKMTRKVKEMPLETLRQQLIQKKLIKASSKAPESVLRQIAADSQIVAGKAL